MLDYCEEIIKVADKNMVQHFYRQLPIQEIYLTIDKQKSLSHLMKEALSKLIKSRYEELSKYGFA